MEVFLDELILENFIVNFFLISITGKLLKIKVHSKNIAIAALIGSLMVLTLIYPSLYILNNILLKIVVALLMTFLSFRPSNIINALKQWFVFMLSTLLLAGLCFFIEFNTLSGGVLEAYGIRFTYKKFIIAIIILYLFMDRIFTYIMDRKILNRYIYDVVIGIKGNERSFKALLDTGSELREPVTNLPVIIVDRDVIGDYMPSEEECYYIPYKVINGTGKLRAFRPNKIIILKETEIISCEALIAPSDTPISVNRDYKALLSRGIMEYGG